MGALGDQILGDRETEPLCRPRDEGDPTRDASGNAVARVDLPAVGLGLPVLDEPALRVGQAAHAAQPIGRLADAQSVEIDVPRGVGLRPGVPGGEQADARHDDQDRGRMAGLDQRPKPPAAQVRRVGNASRG